MSNLEVFDPTVFVPDPSRVNHVMRRGGDASAEVVHVSPEQYAAVLKANKMKVPKTVDTAPVPEPPRVLIEDDIPYGVIKEIEERVKAKDTKGSDLPADWKGPDEELRAALIAGWLKFENTRRADEFNARQ